MKEIAMKKLLACFLSAAALVCVLSGCARIDDGVDTDKPEVTAKVSASPSRPCLRAPLCPLREPDAPAPRP